MIIVETARGPWKKCVNMDCPTNERKTPARGRGRGGATAKAAKKSASASASKKTVTKMPAAKRGATKKATPAE